MAPAMGGTPHSCHRINRKKIVWLYYVSSSTRATLDGLGCGFVFGNKLTTVKLDSLESKISRIDCGATFKGDVATLDLGLSDL
jgi:hypothetical protein